jgi:hypothetical protein
MTPGKTFKPGIRGEGDPFIMTQLSFINYIGLN